MKTYTGSLQRKGRRYYLVTTTNGRQKWFALRTDNLRLARIRATALAPSADADEIGWLRALVRIGEMAGIELQRRNLAANLSWDSLWNLFLKRSLTPVPSASRSTYRRWIDILAMTARTSPSRLSTEDVRRIAVELRARYISADRMLRFFRRVWRTLALDDAMWHNAHILGSARQANDNGNIRQREYYRRLSVAEVRKILARLSDAPDYADMVRIGFYTGLRLSDVAELEHSEIAPDGKFLSIVPNKVRHAKPRPISIPLVDAVRQCVQRRQMTCVSSEEPQYLFPASVRSRPSRALCAAFRAAGVMRIGNGRASFHSLRATFISLMDEAGVPPHITDAITGHAGGDMHARYTQPTPAALYRAVQHALPTL